MVQLAFNNCYLLNASRASIPFNQLNILNGLRHQLGDEVWSIKDQSLEQPSWLDSASKLICESENLHVKFEVNYKIWQEN